MIKSFFSTIVICLNFLNFGLAGDCVSDSKISPVSQSVSDSYNSGEADYDPPEASNQPNNFIKSFIYTSNFQVYRSILLSLVLHGSFQSRAPPYSA